MDVLQREEKYLSELLFPLLEKYWDIFRKNVEQTRKNADADNVHDLRVSIRRLRSAVRVFEDLSVNVKCKPLHKELKSIMSPFGELRDLHVQYNVLKPTASIDKTPFLIPYIEKIRDEIDIHEDNLEDKISRFKINKSDKVVKSLLSMGSIRLKEKKKYKIAIQSGLNNPAIRNVLQSYLMKCFSYLPLIENEKDVYHFHRLRVAVKKLRYKLEFLHPLLGGYGEKDIEFFKDIQDATGDAHDIDVACENLVKYLQRGNEEYLSQDIYKKWLQNFAERRRKHYLEAKKYLNELARFNFLPLNNSFCFGKD